MLFSPNKTIWNLKGEKNKDVYKISFFIITY